MPPESRKILKIFLLLVSYPKSPHNLRIKRQFTNFMSETETKSEPDSDAPGETAAERKTDIEEFTEDFGIQSVSSAEMIKDGEFAPGNSSLNEEDENVSILKSKYQRSKDVDFSAGEIDSLIEKSPVFKELSEPKLPALPKENRARLQMQSPTRLHFYWSIKNNPFQTLNRVFGGNAQDYTLVVKLVNRTRNREELVPIESEGATWFDVDADSTYRAEIGFTAAQRPFIRLMFSNTVETPRKNPSPRGDFSLDWAVSANQFAQVLDVSGYAQDAVEVALAGDDFSFAETATRNAFSQVTGDQENDFTEDNSSEIRFTLLALAAGYRAENLRGQISHSLFMKLLENVETVSAEKAFIALQENFGEFTEEIVEEDRKQTIFGISSINFPKFSKRRILPKFAPVSSFSNNLK